MSSSDDLASRPFKSARLASADDAHNPFLEKPEALLTSNDELNNPFIIVSDTGSLDQLV